MKKFAELSPAAQAAARAIYKSDGGDISFEELSPLEIAVYAARGQAAVDATETLVKAEAEQLVEAALTRGTLWHS